MMIKNVQGNNDWEDFEVYNTKTGISDARSYYDSYICFINIVKALPRNELVKKGWISSKDDIKSMVPLYQSIHSNEFNSLFRKSNQSNNFLCAAWQARIASTAKLIYCDRNIAEYTGISQYELKEIAQLSANVKNIKNLPELLADKGIILIYDRGLSGMKLDGVVFSLAESANPVIGLSFRYPRLDYFWFTLLHELSHIVLHSQELRDPIFDDLDENMKDKDIIELEANRLAKNSFVDRVKWRNCKAKYSSNNKDVIEFAKEQHIHPAIVAGLLQYESESYNKYRDIIDEINVREEVFGNE